MEQQPTPPILDNTGTTNRKRSAEPGSPEICRRKRVVSHDVFDFINKFEEMDDETRASKAAELLNSIREISSLEAGAVLPPSDFPAHPTPPGTPIYPSGSPIPTSHGLLAQTPTPAGSAMPAPPQPAGYLPGLPMPSQIPPGFQGYQPVIVQPGYMLVQIQPGYFIPPQMFPWAHQSFVPYHHQIPQQCPHQIHYPQHPPQFQHQQFHHPQTLSCPYCFKL